MTCRRLRCGSTKGMLAAKVALVARHGYVLETGGVALEGEADGLMDNPHVRKAYLGI